MGFLTPEPSDEDERLPGAAGLHLDTDPHRCPRCRREVAPWQPRCPRCDLEAVPASQLPGEEFALPPGLQDLADDLDGPQADPPNDRQADLPGEVDDDGSPR